MAFWIQASQALGLRSPFSTFPPSCLDDEDEYFGSSDDFGQTDRTLHDVDCKDDSEAKDDDDDGRETQADDDFKAAENDLDCWLGFERRRRKDDRDGDENRDQDRLGSHFVVRWIVRMRRGECYFFLAVAPKDSDT